MKNEALAKILNECEIALSERNVKILEKLQGGLSETIIYSSLKGFDAIHTDVTTLYSWHDGVNESLFNQAIETLELFPESIMLSLEYALKVYESSVVQDKLWSSQLFPIFTDGGGGYLLIEIKDGQNGAIYLYSPSLLLTNEPASIYDSLEMFFRTSISCLNDGAFSVNEAALFDVDFDKRFEIAKKLNPKSDYWKSESIL